MPTLVGPRYSAPAPDPPRKRWTRCEVALLESEGLLQGLRFELIDGELMGKMGMNRRHAKSVVLVSVWMAKVFGGLRVQVQMPIDVAAADNPMNEPEPDAVALVRDTTELDENPRPSELLLVVEVSDTTLTYDSTVKAALYARAGIADYWIADLNARRLIVHRDPHEGSYRSIRVYHESEPVAPLAAPEASVRASELMP